MEGITKKAFLVLASAVWTAWLEIKLLSCLIFKYVCDVVCECVCMCVCMLQQKKALLIIDLKNINICKDLTTDIVLAGKRR